MHRNIKEIEITFENTDYITIPYEYFVSFDHKKSDTSILKRLDIREVNFVLKGDLNDACKSLDYDIHVVDYENKTLFERIAEYRDIVVMRVRFSDNSMEEFLTEWEDDDCCEYRNKLQEATFMEDDLQVVIKKSR